MDEILRPRAAAEPPHSIYRATMADGRGDNDARQRTAWSRDEEKKLLSPQDRLGNNWKDIALELPDRTAKMCRLKFARLSSVDHNPPARRFGCGTTRPRGGDGTRPEATPIVGLINSAA